VRDSFSTLNLSKNCLDNGVHLKEEEHSMLVQIEDIKERFYLVQRSALAQLITCRKLRKLRRSTGWIDITNDPRNGQNDGYEGDERRISVVNMHELSLNENLKHSRIDMVLGQSALIKRVISQIELVSPTSLSVLIQGETGTGKGVIARVIHGLSDRKDKPFIAVDCGTIAGALIESELFGHERGAFTGAYEKKIGKFVLANTGTIFLDEVGNLPKDLQAKLLQCLEERVIYLVGGVRPLELNVRVISAANSDLVEEVRKSNFRADLYFRLNEFAIQLPPLKERPEDILIFAEVFLSRANIELGKNVVGFSKEAADFLIEYPWPGNVRELKHAIRGATLLADNGIIGMKHLSVSFCPGQTMSFLDAYLERALIKGGSMKEIIRGLNEEAERVIIKKALDMCHNNKAVASKLLKVDYSTFYRKLKRYGTERQDCIIDDLAANRTLSGQPSQGQESPFAMEHNCKAPRA
jgi:transcriptional regulator with GAF, ATPase, and Fis domain